IPASASVPVQSPRTALLLHPYALPSRVREAPIGCAVLSILTVAWLAASTLPALSTLQKAMSWRPSAERWTVAPSWVAPPSTVKWVALTPERPSEASRLTVTSVFVQSTLGAVVTGAVRSMLMPLTDLVVLLSAWSWIVSVAAWPAPSLERESSAGHVPSRPESPSEHVQWTLTEWLYQPSAL